MRPARFQAATSHRIELTGPGRLRKDLSDGAWLAEAGATRSSLHDPAREPAAYRSLLEPCGVGPRCLASGTDWVEIELVRGAELWQIGDLAVWVAAARALATTHDRLRSMADAAIPFLVHDDRLATKWRRRAAASGAPARVLDADERAWQRLQAVPATVIHGDMYPSNVLVRYDGTSKQAEIIFIDWELVGLGPAVLDVAALTAGSWPAETVDALTHGYFETASALDDSFADWETWCADLDAARLHLCVQWLGWAPGWRPPKAHRRDWLRDACAMVERV
jgi:Ser/Thr protein kinase RdoA (MazF antagonist)